MLPQPSASCEELHALQAKLVAPVVAEVRDLCRGQHLDASSIVRAVVEEGLLGKPTSGAPNLTESFLGLHEPHTWVGRQPHVHYASMSW